MMNFDGIAPWYRTFEYLAFGGSLQRARLQFIDYTKTARRVLILGDGDGRFTAEFVNQNPEAAVDSVDLSERMIELAKRRMPGADVRFFVNDARTVSLPGVYDLIVTHFFLDCFTQQDCEALVKKVAQHCTPNAKWLVSEFRVPASGVGKWAARETVRFMYFFFSVLTGLTVTQLPNYGTALEQSGFRITHRQTILAGFVVAEMWTL